MVKKTKQLIRRYEPNTSKLIGTLFFLFSALLICYNIFSYFDVGFLSKGLNDDKEIFSQIENYLAVDLPKLQVDDYKSVNTQVAYESKDEIKRYQIKNAKNLLSLNQQEILIQPVLAEPSSYFGYRVHPIFKRKMFHQGIDLPRPFGESIKAALSGKVIFSGQKSGYGNVVILKHAKDYTTVYGHNSKNLVKVGQTVLQNQTIALVGATGNSTGPHLHFELLKSGIYLNPEKYLANNRRLY